MFDFLLCLSVSCLYFLPLTLLADFVATVSTLVNSFFCVYLNHMSNLTQLDLCFIKGSAVIQAQSMNTQTHQLRIFCCKTCNNFVIGLRCFLHHTSRCCQNNKGTAIRAIPWLSKDRKTILGPKPPFLLQWIDCEDCPSQLNICLDIGMRLPLALKWAKLVWTCMLTQARKKTLLACSKSHFQLHEVIPQLATLLL